MMILKIQITALKNDILFTSSNILYLEYLAFYKCFVTAYNAQDITA